MIPNLLDYSTTQVGTAVANDSSELAVAAIGTNALLSGLRAAGEQQYTAADLVLTLTLTLTLP